MGRRRHLELISISDFIYCQLGSEVLLANLCSLLFSYDCAADLVNERVCSHYSHCQTITQKCLKAILNIGVVIRFYPVTYTGYSGMDTGDLNEHLRGRMSQEL